MIKDTAGCAVRRHHATDVVVQKSLEHDVEGRIVGGTWSTVRARAHTVVHESDGESTLYAQAKLADIFFIMISTAIASGSRFALASSEHFSRAVPLANVTSPTITAPAFHFPQVHLPKMRKKKKNHDTANRLRLAAAPTSLQGN